MLEVHNVFGNSTVTTAMSSSPMKLLTPVSRGKSVWAYTSNFGGGLVAGDQTRLEVKLGPETRCYFGTQSSTKVYRCPAGTTCSHFTHASVDADSILAFVPEPVQAFASSHYVQRQEFYLQGNAGLVLLDWFTSGRAARGERWNFSRLESRNDIFLNDERMLADPLRLTSRSVRNQMGRFNCFASLVLVGVPLKVISETLLQEIASRPIRKNAALYSSASPVRGGALLRIAGEDVETVRREIQVHLGFLAPILGDDPWSRKW
jgi:urease accessory protein